MGLHRSPGEVELAPDLGARVPERNQPDDLGLTGRQFVPGNCPSNRLKTRRDAWAYVLLTARGGAARLD
jgi:hypothetical protein